MYNKLVCELFKNADGTTSNMDSFNLMRKTFCLKNIALLVEYGSYQHVLQTDQFVIHDWSV